MILHIPHASTLIPDEQRSTLLLSDADLERELLCMTDRHTDLLFRHPDAIVVCFPLSRLVVDVERFPDDGEEPMAEKGMGRFYSLTSDGKPLRKPLGWEEESRRCAWYERHHHALSRAVEKELEASGRALIVDCHSFPDLPLPCDIDQSRPRPEICIGTDPFHTPAWIADFLEKAFMELGYEVERNRPFAGAIVPLKTYRIEPRVWSVMIEINRRLYMDEPTGLRLPRFGFIQRDIATVLDGLQHTQP